MVVVARTVAVTGRSCRAGGNDDDDDDDDGSVIGTSNCFWTNRRRTTIMANADWIRALSLRLNDDNASSSSSP